MPKSFAKGGEVISSQVLHIDRNNYYGGQSASLNLNQARPCCAGPPACMGMGSLPPWLKPCRGPPPFPTWPHLPRAYPAAL